MVLIFSKILKWNMKIRAQIYLEKMIYIWYRTDISYMHICTYRCHITKKVPFFLIKPISKSKILDELYLVWQGIWQALFIISCKNNMGKIKVGDCKRRKQKPPVNDFLKTKSLNILFISYSTWTLHQADHALLVVNSFFFWFP